MKYLLVLISLLFCACCHKAPEPLRAEFSGKSALSCTVQLKVMMSNGSGYGNGVFLVNRPGHSIEIITANHVVRRPLPILARYPGSDWFPVVKMKSDAKSDLAIVMAPPPEKRGCEAALSKEAFVQDRVWSAAYGRFGWEVTDGVIRSVIKNSKRREYMHSCDIVKGWSGGGLWDGNGRLVGINSSVSARVVMGFGRKGLAPVVMYTPGHSFAVHTSEIIKFIGKEIK